MLEYHFCLGGARCPSRPITFQHSLVVNISGSNQLMHLSYHCHFIFLFLFNCFLHVLPNLTGSFSYDLFILLFVSTTLCFYCVIIVLTNSNQYRAWCMRFNIFQYCFLLVILVPIFFVRCHCHFSYKFCLKHIKVLVSLINKYSSFMSCPSIHFIFFRTIQYIN